MIGAEVGIIGGLGMFDPGGIGRTVTVVGAGGTVIRDPGGGGGGIIVFGGGPLI